MRTSTEILLVTEDDRLAVDVANALASTDLSLLRMEDHQALASLVDREKPRLVLVDGEMEEGRILALIEDLSRSETHTGVLVLVSETDDRHIAALLTAGADDVVARRLRPWGFKARITSQVRRLETARKLELEVRDSGRLLQLTSTLVGADNLSDNLFAMVGMLSAELEVTRCSVVLVRPELDYGLVVASSDDPKVRRLPLDLGRYPEIRSVVREGRPLVIPDLAVSSLHDGMRDELQGADVTSVALFPIARDEDILGVIFLRFAKRRNAFEERERIFCQTVANATAIALRNNEILESLRAKEEEVVQVVTEARSQLEALRRYEDFFRGSTDGMIVLSDTSVVLFVNPTGARMLGLPEQSIRGFPFSSLVAPRERGRLESLIDSAGISRGHTADFTFASEDDMSRIVSMSAGPLGTAGMTLLTMRDVTLERHTARRLDEARERLIESEKRSAMMEVAGAAAHELNQPLTSVMTTIAVLRRIIEDEDGTVTDLIDTMEQESERMATIIRRLSKLTEYSTKSYVGEARIIDLEAAADGDLGEGE